MATERLQSPLPHDPLDPLDAARQSGDLMTTNGDEAPDPAEELLDRVIGGRYRITRVIGRGGMGVVYQATHLELDQEVAIKVLPASFARDAETLKRFEREAKTASRVRHPNVVTVFDLGRLTSGEPYLVMELLDGHDLAQRMAQRGTLPLSEVVDILAPIAAAIDALHLEGVVHRDIKPSNIFFTRTKAMGEIVKLVDFGLAALHEREGSERLTRVGHVVGTAVYMAPEAARGELSGPAGDVYALGVVAFEMLTAAAPFDGQPMAVLMDKVSEVAPTLTRVSGQPFPDSVEAVFASVLQRAPDRRPKSAVAFVDALRHALRDHALMPAAGLRSRPPPPETASTARPPSPPPSDERPLPGARSRAPWITAAVLLLGALGLGGWWALGSTPSTPIVTPLPSPPRPEPSLLLDPTSAPDPAPPPTEVTALPATTTAPATTSTASVDRTPHPTRVARGEHDAARPPTTAVTTTTTTTPAAPPSSTTAAEATSTTGSGPSSTDRSADLVRQAQTAMLHGQIADARALYDEATRAAPRMAAAWRGLGLASERLGLSPEARRAYARYLELAPDARDAPTVRERLEHLGP
ncbi:MAG: protein kinase [Sandaracinus sp.]